ncbi:MAG: hypothetical protein R2784_06595 [Saprospiraceae bacterium]
MYRKTMKTLRLEMDSLCVVKKDSLIAYMVDSLLDANIREINRQLERIKNLQENEDTFKKYKPLCTFFMRF